MPKIRDDFKLEKLKDLGFVEECNFYSLLVSQDTTSKKIRKDWKLEISVNIYTREVLIYGTIDSRKVYDIIGNMPDIIYDMIKNDIIVKE